MKALEVGPVRERCGLAQAFEAVFGEATLREVHGASLRAGAWAADGRRTLRFDVAVDGIPPEIRRFFCGRRMRVTTRQAVRRAADEWTVANSLKMHFLGAELFSIRPRFTLRACGPTVELSGTVEHRARLPPPLGALAEELMARHSRREVDRFALAARRALWASSSTGGDHAPAGHTP